MAYDDYEQGERVREWLRHNGVAILVGIVIGLALIFGYRQWDKHRASERADAAVQYQLIRSAYQGGQNTQAGTLTESLMKNHGKSAYAVFAATLRARHQLDSGHPDAAAESLQWAVQHASDKPLQALSRVRLARALLAAGKAQQALDALDAIPEDNFTAMAAELRGDAQVKLGHDDAAAKAYKIALSAFAKDAPQHHIIEMKIGNLAMSTADKPATAAPASSSPQQDT